MDKKDFNDEDALSPVIGSVILLAISIMAITSALYFGVPIIQKIQDGESTHNMANEFERLSYLAEEFNKPLNSARSTLTLPAGELTLRGGSQISVATNENHLNLQCIQQINDWWNITDNHYQLEIKAHDGENCAPIHQIQLDCINNPVVGANIYCLQISYEKDGINFATRVERPLNNQEDCTSFDADSLWTNNIHNFCLYDKNTGNPIPITKDANWEIKLINTDNGYREYYNQNILKLDQIHWNLVTSVTNTEMVFEGGAIYTSFNEFTGHRKQPQIQEESLLEEQYNLLLVDWQLSHYVQFKNADKFDVTISTIANTPLKNNPDTISVQYEFHGTYAEHWCDMIHARNGLEDFTIGAYHEPDLSQITTSQIQVNKGINECNTPLDVNTYSVSYTTVDATPFDSQITIRNQLLGVLP